MIGIKLKYKLALARKELLFFLGLDDFLLKNRYGERILVFHGIDSLGNTNYNGRFISKYKFEEIIIYISTHFNVISMNDFYNKKFRADTLNIAITFDDGYMNNYHNALPILMKYNIPATFYITTIHEKEKFLWPDFVDLISMHTDKKNIFFENKLFKRNSKNEFVHKGISLKNKCKSLPYDKIVPLYEMFHDEWLDIADTTKEYWQLMSHAQLRAICKNELFTIGSHGYTHANLEVLNTDSAREEVMVSKQILENLCNDSIEEFAFPFGTYNTKLIELCKSVGYKRILLVDYKNNTDEKDQSTRTRFVINPYISIKQQIAFLLKGSYI